MALNRSYIVSRILYYDMINSAEVDLTRWDPGQAGRGRGRKEPDEVNKRTLQSRLHASTQLCTTSAILVYTVSLTVA